MGLHTLKKFKMNRNGNFSILKQNSSIESASLTQQKIELYELDGPKTHLTVKFRKNWAVHNARRENGPVYIQYLYENT